MSGSEVFGARSLTAGVKNLKASASAALEDAREQHGELQSHIDESSSLVELLSDLPQKIRHPIMVPFGGAAFFPGRLIHTNEVMVDVGSGLFLECSTTHAKGIVKRRIDKLEDTLKDAEEEIQTLEAQIEDYRNQELQGMVDIVEKYDEELHGSKPPGFVKSAPGRDSVGKEATISGRSEEGGHGEASQDSDEELFRMIDRMAVLEADAEAEAKGRPDGVGEEGKHNPSHRDAPKSQKPVRSERPRHQTGLKRGFLLERREYKDGKVVKESSGSSPAVRDKQPIRREDPHVVEHNPDQFGQVSAKPPSSPQADTSMAPRKMSKFKQKMMEKRASGQ